MATTEIKVDLLILEKLEIKKNDSEFFGSLIFSLIFSDFFLPGSFSLARELDLLWLGLLDLGLKLILTDF